MVKENTMKQTEISLLPVDWHLKKLGSVAFITKLAGFEYSKYFNSYKDGGEIIVVRGTNITNNKLDLSDTKYIPRKTSDFLHRSKLSKRDLVFAYVGTIGPIYLIKENNRFHLGPNTAKIKIEDKDVNTDYIFNYFLSEFIRKEIDDRISVGAQPSLSMAKIRDFSIPLPPLPEQEAIAEALSDADAWIESLEQLIAKKRLIKQGAMQELLSPKEDWEVKKLGEIGSFFSTNSLSRDDLNYLDGQIYNIHYGDIHTRFKSHFKLENELVPFINETSIVNKKFNRCQVGDLIIADASENETDIGKAIEISTLDEKQVVSGLHTIHYRPYPQTFSLDYLGHLWQSRFIKEQILKEAQGTKVLGISVNRMRYLNIPVVSLAKQTRIATILSDIDAELEALEVQLAKARKVKQGMMQELLTGRVRMV